MHSDHGIGVNGQIRDTVELAKEDSGINESPVLDPDLRASAKCACSSHTDKRPRKMNKCNLTSAARRGKVAAFAQ